MKSAYESFVAYASKVGELYTNLAKETVKPYEAIVSKAQAAAAKCASPAPEGSRRTRSGAGPCPAPIRALYEGPAEMPGL
jgi:hypothetical protein